MTTKVKHWQDPVNLILGLWLIVAPWVLAFRDDRAAMWNSIILGVLIGASAIYALVRVFAWEEWANVVFGLWLVISPWVLGFSHIQAAAVNAVVVGLVVAVLALWALGTDRDIGGWWSPAH